MSQSHCPKKRACRNLAWILFSLDGHCMPRYVALWSTDKQLQNGDHLVWAAVSPLLPPYLMRLQLIKRIC